MPIFDNWLHSKTGILDVGIKAAKFKWDWVGHVNTERWAKAITEWIPTDTEDDAEAEQVTGRLKRVSQWLVEFNRRPQQVERKEGRLYPAVTSKKVFTVQIHEKKNP